MAPQSKRGQEQKKKKPPKSTKASFQSPKKFLACSIVIRV
jgi:hypothetical protein